MHYCIFLYTYSSKGATKDSKKWERAKTTPITNQNQIYKRASNIVVFQNISLLMFLKRPIHNTYILNRYGRSCHYRSSPRKAPSRAASAAVASSQTSPDYYRLLCSSPFPLTVQFLCPARQFKAIRHVK